MLSRIRSNIFLIVVLGTAIVVLVFGSILNIPRTPGENVIMVLLGLLAFDSFQERINLLQKIERRLDELEFRHTPVLLTKSRLLEQTPLDELITPNCHLILIGASAKSLVETNAHIFQKAQSARVVLMNPNSESALATYYLMSDYHLRDEIDHTVRELQDRIRQVEIRYVDFYLPYTLLGVDVGTGKGAILVNYRGYDTSLHDRHSFLLTRRDHAEWFEDYLRQFQKLWEDSDPASGKKRIKPSAPPTPER